uniref:Regulation of nuclear pre-mRNA domain-containing protein 2 n=1 Tax=Leptobrachium leishanense TaxID=445787 RepID=A0A8C5QVZ8_9ANUR
MAAGGSKAGALEAALDRKLQAVTNTMESIQSLSSWCLENRKHHSLIVHYWLKWVRRSGVSHRLNLFYLANDVLQNCKRKSALIYRDTFSDVLAEASSLVRDASVMKSIERIFKIWEERNVYSEDTISTYRTALKGGGHGSRERSEKSKSVRPKPVEKVQEAAPTVNPKAALKSKIVAEFRPQKLIDDLGAFKRATDHVDIKEKQLSNMRVDVCSTETLKRLKDKAGGKKFSKDFEEASAKLEEFVNTLEKQVKNGPSLADELENACIFYEAQYREVKVVVNAYKTFANRVSNLKKKLDQLKATLPDPEESPVPSPTVDAPSPTGSESPFPGMGAESPLSPEVEPIPSVSPEQPTDNRDVEDMDLSDVDADEISDIIVDERQEPAALPIAPVNAVEDVFQDVPAAVTESITPTPVSAPVPVVSPVSIPTSIPISTQALVSTPLLTTPTTTKTVTTPSTVPAIPLALPNLANVDLGKISSILSSLTSVMKNTGLSSFIQSVAMSSGSATHTTSSAPSTTAAVSTMKDRAAPLVTPSVPKNTSPSSSNSPLPVTKVAAAAGHGSSGKQAVNPLIYSSQPSLSTENPTSQPPPSKSSNDSEPSSLELKIHNFLKGNPGFSGLDLNIPILSGVGSATLPEPASDFNPTPANTSLDNVDGTPVRDERSGTPTQDEMMDKPTASSVDTASLLSKIISPDSSTPSSSRSPLLSKESDFQKLTSMPSYRAFAMGGNSPNAYIQSADTLEPRPTIDTQMNKFYPETTFPEDEDYRDFDFSGPPPPAAGGLETIPSKSVKPSVHLEPAEYPQGPPSFGQPQDFGRQPFPQSMHPFNLGDSGGRLSPSSDMYGSYSLRAGNLDADRSSPMQKEESYFPPDSHSSLAGLHTRFSDSPHGLQNRPPNLGLKSNLPPRPMLSSAEQPGSAVSTSTTMEFKNMLKNASRRPSDEHQFNQTSLNEGPTHPGLVPDERQRPEEHYRIETRVSSSSVDLLDNPDEQGAPIETLGYHNAGNQRISGEPIKIVESVRLGVKGNRGHGIDGNRGGWFEEGPPSAENQGSSSVGGFKTQFEEHMPRFPKSMPPFDHHVPPPNIVASLERGGPFQIEHTGPPTVPPPGLPPDHGSLFGRDIPVAARMSSMEPHGPHPVEHGMNPFPGHPEHGNLPFSPPPHLDMRNPFSQDHGTLHPGAMKEHYGMHPGSARDHGHPPRDHNGPPLGRLNEPMAPNSRDQHGPHRGHPHHQFPQHRDDLNPGGGRPHRPSFRPREPYNSLKRPRPPFGRGSQFFSPKRPYYSPRY